MMNTRLMLKRGFTLIELLIVIAVLGILAVAVLAAINPIEQINRSRDTGSRSDAEQLLGAIDRFYATQGYYPWLTAPCAAPGCEATTWNKVDSTWSDGTSPVLDKLSQTGTGEIKESFTKRIVGSGYNTLYKYNDGSSGSSTYICFASQSNSFSTEAWKRCGEATSGIGLPDDLQDVAGSICLGATAKNFSCLP